LTTPAGAVLSVEAPADHPWHHALWFTIKFVNDENFWEEYGDFGTLRTTAVESDGDTTTARLDWIAPDGASVRLHETRTLTVASIDADTYAIDWSEHLEVGAPTTLDRTPFTTWGGYGGLTLRGAPDWTDTVITLDDGVARERTLGERSRWLAVEGTARARDGGANGRAEMTEPERSGGEPRRSEPPSSGSDGGASGAAEMTAGVTILDHPSNPRAPTPWYASNRADTYGEGWANFVNAALLWDESLTVEPGAPLRLRYRVLVHDGVWTPDRIEREYAAWTT
jgi:hypothetical protein